MWNAQSGYEDGGSGVWAAFFTFILAFPVLTFLGGLVGGLIGRGLIGLLSAVAGLAVAFVALSTMAPSTSDGAYAVRFVVMGAVPVGLGYGVGQAIRARRNRGGMHSE
jgi:hypothetical protein